MRELTSLLTYDTGACGRDCLLRLRRVIIYYYNDFIRGYPAPCGKNDAVGNGRKFILTHHPDRPNRKFFVPIIASNHR